MNAKMRIGGHVSAAGGLSEALRRGREIGANTIQIFGSSPRQWGAKMPNDKETEEFRGLAAEMDIRPVFLHAPYLINLASPEEDLRRKSEVLLKKNLEIAEMINAAGVIFHLGSSKGGNSAVAREHLAEAMIRITSTPGQSRLILENSAGGGDKLGSSLEDLANIFRSVKKSGRVAICFDTAHALEAGVVNKYDAASVGFLESEIERLIGWENIFCLHANDSKTVANSHHARHENIGRGQIGIGGFEELAKSKNFGSLPWLLEVPGFRSEGPDRENIDILWGIFGGRDGD
ncbi:MAG: deoxyribonuclease IV [Candidatus Liptonbacteria bacterium]